MRALIALHFKAKHNLDDDLPKIEMDSAIEGLWLRLRHQDLSGRARGCGDHDWMITLHDALMDVGVHELPLPEVSVWEQCE